ncbi:chemotaxis response regulator protein-glutamate methylesterase [Polynucleobacter paneuropaeus]|nr:chemotaxis response regulator protein-glutamate methylesterase [Polynucleobacter paneuropaeus]
MPFDIPKIKILIVDDSAVIRRLLSTAISKQEDMEVMGTAANGLLGVEFIKSTPPDLVLLDIEMPVMDGIEALKAVRQFNSQIPIIVFSSLTQKGASTTIDALTSGASDYVPKPTNTQDLDQAFKAIEEQLLPKIRNLHTRKQGKGVVKAPAVNASSTLVSNLHSGTTNKLEALCIGVSTGGPAALMQLFAEWKRPLSVPVFIVQHMPPKFTEFLAARLTEIGCMLVEEPYEGQTAMAGRVYLAPGGMHMELLKEGPQVVMHLHDGPLENSCRPAVDVLFRSAAKVYGSSLLALVLTGMGSDGLKGAQEIHQAGGTIITQDEESSVVWGMPGAVTKANLAHAVLPLNALAAEIERLTCKT